MVSKLVDSSVQDWFEINETYKDFENWSRSKQVPEVNKLLERPLRNKPSIDTMLEISLKHKVGQ
jgi:hypothetical protein